VKDFLITTFGHNTASLVRAVDALILRQHLNQSAQTLSLEVTKKTSQT